MPQGTRKVVKQKQDAYVHYEFVYVLCNVCGEKSNDFAYKEHLNGDETIAYIEQITGFVINKADDAPRQSTFVASGSNYDKGGLVCPTCVVGQIQVEEVANG